MDEDSPNRTNDNNDKYMIINLINLSGLTVEQSASHPFYVCVVWKEKRIQAIQNITAICPHQMFFVFRSSKYR